MNPGKPKTFLFLIPFVLFLGGACTKGGSSGSGKGGNDTSTTTTTLDPGDSAIVYVAGGNGKVLYCWRNGVATQLPLPVTPLLPKNYVPTGGGYTSAMTLSDTDVYICGGLGTTDTTREMQGQTACYWRNGVPFNLQDSAGAAKPFGIAVSGSNVLVGGTESYAEPTVVVPYSPNTPIMSYAKWGDIAVCWTNGVPAYVPESYAYVDQYHDTTITELPDYVNGIAVNGADIYLVGGEASYTIGVSSTLHFTGYWKNGVFHDLPNRYTGTIPNDSTNWFYPHASSIAVSGSDVYACGTDQDWVGRDGDRYLVNYHAMLWKNGALTYLAGTNSTSGANALCVSGSDVYVAGYLGPEGKASHAVYWKNGAPVMLDSTSDVSAAQYIAVVGDNVYVAGWVNNTAVYWRNGKIFPLNGIPYYAICGIAARNPHQRK